jgi:hypothetical protein
MTARLQVELQALVGTYFSDLTRAADKLKSFSDDARNAGATLSAAFTLPLALFGRAAVKSGAELDGLNRSMQAIEGSAEGASKRIKILNEIAKLPGLNFKDVVQGDVNLRSAGISADLAAKSMSAFGNALGILGKTGALGNVNAQIQQMASKTQGFGVDLKILKEWVPQVGVALQNTFGTANADLITKMGYTGAQVVEKLTNELAKLPKATGGIGNALENMDDAWFKFTGRLGLAIDKAVDLTGIFNKVSDTLNDLATWFEKLDPFWQKTIIGIAGVTAVIGPLLLGLAAISPLFGAIGTAAGLLFSGPVVVAFATVAAAFVAAKVASDIYTNGWESFWDRLKYKAESTAIEIGLIMRKMELRLLDAMNFNGSTDAAISRKENELLNIEHGKNAHVSIGNAQFNRKPTPTTAPPPKLLSGGGDKEAELKKQTEQLLYEIDLKKRNEIADRALVASTESLRAALANLANERLKIDSPIASLLPSNMATQMELVMGGMGEKMNSLMVQMRDNFKARALEIKSAIKEDLLAGLNQIMSQGADQAFMGMLEWGGAFMAGAKGIKDFGNVMKAIFGDIMISLGKQMIVTSEAWIAFKKAIMLTGVGGLAIGAGLVIAGSALKSSAAKSSGASYQQVPQNSVGNYQPIYTPYTSQGSNSGAKISIAITQGQTIQRGSDIYTTQSNYSYDKGR